MYYLGGPNITQGSFKEGDRSVTIREGDMRTEAEVRERSKNEILLALKIERTTSQGNLWISKS